MGPSGAGKTTLLNMLGGMDSATSGTITLDGARVSSFNRKQLTQYRRHDIGFVFQFYNLVPVSYTHLSRTIASRAGEDTWLKSI